MPRKPEIGVPALCGYQVVRYYPFDVAPDSSPVLTADPWAFLQAWLLGKRANTRGANRLCFERAIYYSQLAEDFYSAAGTSRMPAAATLAYYGMLNLAKAFLSVRGVPLESKWEHHGLSLPRATKQTLEVINPKAGSVGIFQEFAHHLGTPVAGANRFTFQEACCHIPEIHEVAFSLGFVGRTRRSFLPLRIEILVNENKSKIFTEIAYEKRQENKAIVARFYTGRRRSTFRPAQERDGWIVHRSNSRRTFAQKRWGRLYKALCADYEGFDIATLLTRGGYRYYCDLYADKYHHLCYALAAMFYMGTIARYRPTEMRGVLESNYRPLLAEAMAMCPQQFLYQLTSRITSNVCLVPLAMI